jgi:hypothetical protein
MSDVAQTSPTSHANICSYSVQKLVPFAEGVFWGHEGKWSVSWLVVSGSWGSGVEQEVVGGHSEPEAPPP